MKHPFAGCLLGFGLALSPLTGWAGANPSVPFYGGGTITATPSYPIVGESTRIEVVVGNSGDQTATNVQVRVSFNDWGVTFSGWQEIATVTLATIPAGGSATATVEHIFQSRAHTCVEALIVGAAEDTDPNDNRGQINLEVIQAGETFSYGIPIRNDGDAAIQVVIRGNCAGADEPGQVGFPCNPIEAEAVLEPGAEILVPIELDLREVPPGASLDYVVDAFDTLGNHNHVVLRVVRSTAKALKTQALALADDLSDEMPTRALHQRIEAMSRHLHAALKSRAWLDDNRVRRNGGAQVFAQELAAVNQALALIKARLPLAAKIKLNDLVLKLVDADRILAQTALADAVDLEEEDAVEAAGWLGAGDAAREAGQYSRAIGAYRHAWNHAGR